VAGYELSLSWNLVRLPDRYDEETARMLV